MKYFLLKISKKLVFLTIYVYRLGNVDKENCTALIPLWGHKVITIKRSPCARTPIFFCDLTFF